jgi:hypothetical protein
MKALLKLVLCATTVLCLGCKKGPLLRGHPLRHRPGPPPKEVVVVQPEEPALVWPHRIQKAGTCQYVCRRMGAQQFLVSPYCDAASACKCRCVFDTAAQLPVEVPHDGT